MLATISISSFVVCIVIVIDLCLCLCTLRHHSPLSACAGLRLCRLRYTYKYYTYIGPP
jgi:hypothetical protein